METDYLYLFDDIEFERLSSIGAELESLKEIAALYDGTEYSAICFDD